MKRLILCAIVAGCSDAPTVPSDGRLAVAIAGLPAGVDAQVAVSGPDGFSANVRESIALSGLRPGSYTLAALDVTSADARYTAAPPVQTVDVPSVVWVAADDIEYTIATARLRVDVPGLPGNAQAAIVVTGPGGVTRSVAGTTTLHLLNPGTYTLSAATITADGRLHRPAPATQTITLAAGATPSRATVAYGAGSGALDLSITGLTGTMEAAVTVTGPANFARLVTSSTTLRNLDAGTYTMSSSVVGADLTTYTPASATETVTVANDATSSASVAYAGTPLTLRVVVFAQGLTAPVFLTAPDGDQRQFVVERLGRIRVIENGAMLATPFLDIASRVNFTGERGMLGMAFDPGYATNGRLFVFYVNLAGNVVIERFASTPGANVAGASEGIVIAIAHGGSEHHGGSIEFGPDRMLYLGPGDGRCCGDPDRNAQNRYSLLGKILRIDVRTMPYTIPVNNPFVGQDGGGAAEVWAYGLRNPWRFSFDLATKLLYIGDVGQDTREEIDVVPSSAAGLNFGWPLMEGTACFMPASNCATGISVTAPVHEYTHADGCSVTGGFVYRGSAIPELTGRYLYADYCRGWLRSFRASAAGASEHRLWGGVTVARTASFGRDGLGELYMIADSRIWKIIRN